MKKWLYIAACFGWAHAPQIIAQTPTTQADTLTAKQLDEVVVTATRTERKLGNVAVPVTLITQKQIQQAGSLRLKDILQETTGMFITAGFGAGVQMQGLSADYTMILIDGEPMVGRTAGVLDINRLAIGNVRKIEIVKGPSSSLYGSEAMAGVINIITDQSRSKKLDMGLRYGFGNPDNGWALPIGQQTFKQADFNINGSFYTKRLTFKFFSNAFFNDAINYRPFSQGRFPQPVWRLTQQLQMGYKFSDRTKLDIALRNAYDHISKELAVANNGNISSSYGREANTDWNLNPVLTHRFSDRLKTSLRLYHTQFYGSERLRFKEQPDSIYNDEFRQQFNRIENQTDISFGKHQLTLGAGYVIDEARSTRYDDASSRKQNTVSYAFVQQEWAPTEKLSLIAGGRYDDNKLFAAAFSPKLALRYRVSPGLSLNASVGRGFKAPDFRQLYLNFTNISAGGYSVFGTIDAVKIINQLQQRGEIAQVLDDFNKLSTLTPEYSTGFNVGATYQHGDRFQVKLNLFRNDIEGLIEVRQVAIRNNGSQIFSYINLKEAYTQGGDVDFTLKPFKRLTINAGYQLLFTADKDELRRIEAKTEFVRDRNNISRLMTRNEYFGLPNRSRHMANLKFTYETENQFFATLRAIYRSKWAVSNTSGNTVFDKYDEFAEGFVLLNISAGKTLASGIKIQGGMDNVLNYQNIGFLPNLSGRMLYVSAQFNLLRKQH